MRFLQMKVFWLALFFTEIGLKTIGELRLREILPYSFSITNIFVEQSPFLYDSIILVGFQQCKAQGLFFAL